MQFKDISCHELWRPLCSAGRNHLCSFGPGRLKYEEQFEFGPVVQEKMFKDISYLELWGPICSAEWNHLCNFGGGNHEE